MNIFLLLLIVVGTGIAGLKAKDWPVALTIMPATMSAGIGIFGCILSLYGATALGGVLAGDGILLLLGSIVWIVPVGMVVQLRIMMEYRQKYCLH
jgi:hypothetical protein